MTEQEALEVLGLDEPVEGRDLKRAYLRKVKGASPDRAPEEFARIREAFELLSVGRAGPPVQTNRPPESAQPLQRPPSRTEAAPPVPPVPAADLSTPSMSSPSVEPKTRQILESLGRGEVNQARRLVEQVRLQLWDGRAEMESFSERSIVAWLFAQELCRLPDDTEPRYRAALAKALLTNDPAEISNAVANVQRATTWRPVLTAHSTPRLYRFLFSGQATRAGRSHTMLLVALLLLGCVLIIARLSLGA